MDPQFIPIARVLAPWGIRGEVKVESMTDFSDRFAHGETAYIKGSRITIESARFHGGSVILKLSTINSRNQAEELRGSFLEIPLSEMHSLGEGEYYRFQLIGLQVLSTEGKPLGRVSDVISTGGNDVYEITSDTEKFLIPAIDDVVKSINIDKDCMIIELMQGLI